MTTNIPRSMRAIALARHCKPSDYELATLPTPEISKPDQLLIKVHAASVNPIDVKMASSLGKMTGKPTYVHPPILSNPLHIILSLTTLSIDSPTKSAMTSLASLQRSAPPSQTSNPATKSIPASLLILEVPSPNTLSQQPQPPR